MRGDNLDSQIELRFDCVGGGVGLKTVSEPGFGRFLSVNHYSGTVVRLASGSLTVPGGVNVLLVNRDGAAIVRPTSGGKATIVPPKSLFYSRASRLSLQVARGDHTAWSIVWSGSAFPALEALLSGKIGAKSGAEKGSPRLYACKPIGPAFSSPIARLEAVMLQPVGSDAEVRELKVASVVFEVLADLLSGDDQLQLASLPADLPETIFELVDKVRSDPTLSWPLRDAADLAGYSPFHFSRVFKSLVGYGFHEYVDRCRTELAVQFLLAGEMPLDGVSQACGFGTTQGLRESIKEYLGLVPSELRSAHEPISAAKN